MTLEFRKILVLSTSHVTEETKDLLDSDLPLDQWPVSGGPYGDYGWFMYAHEDPDDEKIPAELRVVFAFARANGCDNVLFDCDADQVDGLPTYDW